MNFQFCIIGLIRIKPTCRVLEWDFLLPWGKILISLAWKACLLGHIQMSSIVDRWHCGIRGGQLEICFSHYNPFV